MYRLEHAGGHGIHLPDCGLALDNSHPDAEWVFVSHAHADHLPRNRRTRAIATRATRRFMELRGFRGECREAAFGEPMDLGRCTLTLLPAGHILGSAMALVESPHGRLLYTGDTRTPASPATEGFQLPDLPVDELIIEATFGLPIYRWPSEQELQARLHAFALQTLEEGGTPLFLGYNLGKAQELLHLLAPLGRPMQIHAGGYPLCQIYEEEGIELGEYAPYDRATCDGKILVAPSSVLNTGFAGSARSLRVAYCSGWAALSSRRSQLQADALIPLSDHLDFFELLRVCRELRPGRIHITHTPNPSVVEYFLKREGLNAGFLDLPGLAEGANAD